MSVLRVWVALLVVVVGTAAVMLGSPGLAGAQPMTWTVQSSPNPGSPDNFLGGVSCATDTFCVAVGDYDTGPNTGTTLGLIEQWDGTAWSVASTPQPAGSAGLAGVSCFSSTVCMAVGVYRLSNGTPLAYAEQWNGTAWTLTSAVAPANSGFNGVSCASPSFCVAVGYENNTNGLIETWNGSSWQIASTPATTMHSVSCPNLAFCMAVGSSSGSTDQAQYDGSMWSYSQIPIASNAQLYGVSCPLSSYCIAVGGQNVGNQPLAELWTGSGWSSMSVPGSGGLDAISCISDNNCMAAGDSTTSAGANALVESWNGSAWTQEPAQSPNAENDLYGASCLFDRCFVVGQQFPADGSYGNTLIELGVGQIVGPPAPGPAVPGSWKQKDQQAAKADLPLALENVRIFCTPKALGLGSLGAGVLLFGVGPIAGPTLFLTGVATDLLVTPLDVACRNAIKRLVDDYVRATHDPPDPDYTTLASPAPIASVRLPSCKRRHGSARQFCNKLRKTAKKWVQAAQLVASIDDALLTTRDRESSALAANDQAAVNLQDAHIPVLEQEENAAIAGETADGKSIARLLKSHHIAYRMTRAQSRKTIRAVLRVLDRDGITKAALTALVPGMLTPHAINILNALAEG